MRTSIGPLGIFLLSTLGCTFTTGGRQFYARTYAGNIPLTLVNDTVVPACYVHMGPSTDPNWGDDWLGPTETIAPGAARTFMVAGGPGWDLQIKTCQHTMLSQAQHVPMFTATQLAISSLRPVAYAAPQAQPVYVTPMAVQPGYAAPPPVYITPQKD